MADQQNWRRRLQEVTDGEGKNWKWIPDQGEMFEFIGGDWLPDSLNPDSKVWQLLWERALGARSKRVLEIPIDNDERNLFSACRGVIHNNKDKTAVVELTCENEQNFGCKGAFDAFKKWDSRIELPDIYKKDHFTIAAWCSPSDQGYEPVTDCFSAVFDEKFTLKSVTISRHITPEDPKAPCSPGVLTNLFPSESFQIASSASSWVRYCIESSVQRGSDLCVDSPTRAVLF